MKVKLIIKITNDDDTILSEKEFYSVSWAVNLDEELQSLMMNVNARIEFVKLLSNKLKLVITPEELNELLKLAADHGVKSLIQEIDTRHEFANLLSHQLKLDIMPGVLDDLIKSAAEVSK